MDGSLEDVVGVVRFGQEILDGFVVFCLFGRLAGVGAAFFEPVEGGRAGVDAKPNWRRLGDKIQNLGGIVILQETKESAVDSRLKVVERAATRKIFLEIEGGIE